MPVEKKIQIPFNLFYKPRYKKAKLQNGDDALMFESDLIVATPPQQGFVTKANLAESKKHLAENKAELKVEQDKVDKGKVNDPEILKRKGNLLIVQSQIQEEENAINLLEQKFAEIVEGKPPFKLVKSKTKANQKKRAQKK